MTTEQIIEQLFEELVNKPPYYHGQPIPTNKRKAVKTIVAMGLPVIGCLIRYYDHPSRRAFYAQTIVREIFRELGDKAVTYLFSLLQKGDIETKLDVIEVLKHEGIFNALFDVYHVIKLDFFYNDKRSVDTLINLLNDESEAVRVAAIEALYWFEDSKSIEPLLKFLGDENETVRIAAAKTLAQVKDNRVIEPLLRLLNDESKTVRITVTNELGRIKDSKAIEPLLEHLLDENEDMDVRLATASALASMNEERIFDPLLNFLENKYWKVRFRAASILGYLGDPRALPLLRVHLKDRSKRVRKAVKGALTSFDWERRGRKAS